MMPAETQPTGDQALLRIGAVAAVLGTLLQVTAGTGFGSRPSGSDPEAMLRWLADRPGWYWPGVYLCFILGALLWVGAFSALARSLTEGVPWALGRLAMAAILVGVTIHVVDGSLSGAGLRLLAADWASASGAEQAAVLRDGATLLDILEGTWAIVITLFHGLPFILMGLAVVFSRRYPAWLGWIGFAGGAGSMAAGIAMFATDDAVPDVFFIAGALVISLFMLIAALPMWLLTTDTVPAGGDHSSVSTRPPTATPGPTVDRNRT